jgi:hypothetical protein
MDQIEPIMQFLEIPDRLPYGAIDTIADETGIEANTLRDWRQKLKAPRAPDEPPWRPYQHRNQHRRALTDEQEAALAKMIREQYIDRHRYCPVSTVRCLALTMYYGATSELPDSLDDDDDEGSYGEEERPFKATHRWLTRFMAAHDLSLRDPHAQRRPTVDPESVEEFNLRIGDLLRLYEPWLVLNMDETSWKLVTVNIKTMADRGADGVSCWFPGDPKSCVTVIATIDAAGEKKALWIIARGMTDRCEARFRGLYGKRIEGGQLVITHQGCGWTSRDVAIRYLLWLSEITRGQPTVLVWDLFAAHRDAVVKEQARHLGIRLEFIPPGATGLCQPLDRRIFGILKQRAKARFDRRNLDWAQDEFRIGESIAILIECWDSITQEQVLSAWQHFQDPDEWITETS